MKLEFKILRGRYSCHDVKVNGFRIGSISYSMKRNDELPQVGRVELCGKSAEKQFKTEEEAYEWLQRTATKAIRELAGIND